LMIRYYVMIRGWMMLINFMQLVCAKFVPGRVILVQVCKDLVLD